MRASAPRFGDTARHDSTSYGVRPILLSWGLTMPQTRIYARSSSTPPGERAITCVQNGLHPSASPHRTSAESAIRDSHPAPDNLVATVPRTQWVRMGLQCEAAARPGTS